MNETTNYLHAFYLDFGYEFRMIYESIGSVQLFLGDYNYKNYNDLENFQEFLDDNIIFVLLRKNANLERQLLFMQSHPNYIADYEVGGEKQMVVFRVDEPHKTALKNFKLGRYSKMYKQGDIDRFFDLSASYYLKYHRPGGGMAYINQKNCADIRELYPIFKNLTVSYYHVLSKSDGLRDVLGCAFGIELPAENELKEKIKMDDEFFNYEKHHVKQLMA